ncbi:MAG TPA: hypothetical protein VMS30_00150 [Phycisphaerales bacterium]|nr:hypothetical protein [Phycisphaerales bacterium]
MDQNGGGALAVGFDVLILINPEEFAIQAWICPRSCDSDVHDTHCCTAPMRCEPLIHVRTPPVAFGGGFVIAGVKAAVSGFAGVAALATIPVDSHVRAVAIHATEIVVTMPRTSVTMTCRRSRMA